MDYTIQLLFTISSSCLCGFFLFIYFYHQLAATDKKRLPRAGGALPMIGHLHLFGGKQLLHKTLGTMAEKHGPAFTIKLGSRENLVISSWEMAKECFTTLDKVFADRPKIAAARILCYDYCMFGFAPYGAYWRQMRKIVTAQLLSRSRIDMLAHLRASELQTSLHELSGLQAGSIVDMKEWFGDLTMNALVRMIGGKRFVRANGGCEKKLIREFSYYFGVFNVLSDAIPWLGWFDVQGHERGMKRVAKELDDLMGAWLREHKQMRKTSGRVDEDFMDLMLTILEDTHFTEFDEDTITKSTCLNLVLAGSDATMVTLTWALSLLLNNPSAMHKARDEVDVCVGENRRVNEADISQLVYLEAVVKETLRLYPAEPIIGLRSALEDCTLSTGHHVPAGTQLMVNIWKIQRNGELWAEPLEFRPERFLTSHRDVDMSGLIPFGSGRRSCVGQALALRIVHLTLASLLHGFEFAKPGDADVDMTESPGLKNLKATPLQVYITLCRRPQIYGI